jgi:hypothetical protein
MSSPDKVNLKDEKSDENNLNKPKAESPNKEDSDPKEKKHKKKVYNLNNYSKLIFTNLFLNFRIAVGIEIEVEIKIVVAVAVETDIESAIKIETGAEKKIEINHHAKATKMKKVKRMLLKNLKTRKALIILRAVLNLSMPKNQK